MASTHFGMIIVALFVMAISALEAYQWDGGPEDKGNIRVCLGGSASLPWSIMTGRGETILNIAWWFQAPDKEKTQIATYQSKHFYSTDNVFERVVFLPNAGLSLRFARPQDSGNYSVQVKLWQANSSLVSISRTVTLSVSDTPPATNDGAFYVTTSDAVREDVTQDWTLPLHCGYFVDLGQPPIDVVWKTPSGEVRNSTYQDNGTFVLSVSSPVQGGNYSCHLTASAPAAHCLRTISPLKAAAQLYVDDKDVRLSFLEARQRELEQANKDRANLPHQQANLLPHQVMQISQQNGTITDMVQVNKDQANLLQRQAMQISQQNVTMTDMVQVNKDQANLLQRQAMQISQQHGTMTEMKAELVQVKHVIKDQANLLQHQAMQISQRNRTMTDMVQVNKDQANMLQHQAMQISQQNRTMTDMVQVNKDQANMLQHQAMQISQQNGTMTEMKAELVQVKHVIKDQANLLQHQAMQISQRNRTMTDMVQVNKDQANLLQHQAMQISQQNGAMTEIKAELVEVKRVHKDQANLLQHQAMQISQQNGAMTEIKAELVEVKRVHKDQANLLQHQAMQISQQNGTMTEMKAELVQVKHVIKDQANLLQHQAMQISQQNGTMTDMVQVNRYQANILQHQAMQISQQNRTMADMVQVNKDQSMQISQQNGTMADMVQVSKDQANLLHQAMQISQQNGTMTEIKAELVEVKQVNKDQANLLQRQAMQISQQNGTMADMVQVNKDQANLLQHQAMQISQQNGTTEELKADHLKLTTQLSALTKTVKDVTRRMTLVTCVDWLKLEPLSGIQPVSILGDPITVYCDQTTDGGGWIVFQRRRNADVDFYRGWADYRNGFGDLEGNFWLGLDKLHRLTTSRRYELRVDLQKWDGTRGYATYSNFYVEDESQNFTLRFDRFTGGNAGNSLWYHRGYQFTTKDRDHDKASYNCAHGSHGAWWFHSCFHSNLNGAYINGGKATNEDGMTWGDFGGFTYSQKFSEMKIRPM